MARENKLDPSTKNNDVGLYWGRTRRVDPLGAGLPYAIGELATGIKAGIAGDIVWYNSLIDETSVITVEAGEWVPIACTDILSGATIDGVAETTTAGTPAFWTTTPAALLKTKVG